VQNRNYLIDFFTESETIMQTIILNWNLKFELKVATFSQDTSL